MAGRSAVADCLRPVRSPQMGAELGAAAISHLEHVSEEGTRAMAAAGTVAVLLPTTAYILRLVPPPARQMIQHGVPVALGTDFNPNAYCLSMVRRGRNCPPEHAGLWCEASAANSRRML